MHPIARRQGPLFPSYIPQCFSGSNSLPFFELFLDFLCLEFGGEDTGKGACMGCSTGGGNSTVGCVVGGGGGVGVF